MSDDVMAAVQAALEGKPQDFSDAINSALSAKVQSALEQERKNQASNFFDNDDTDEEEDIQYDNEDQSDEEV